MSNIEDYQAQLRTAVKGLMDLDKIKEMLLDIYERFAKVNRRLDIIEEAVSKSRLKEAKKRLVKSLINVKLSLRKAGQWFDEKLSQ